MLNRRIASWGAIAILACAPVLSAANEAERFTFAVPNAPDSVLHPKDGRFQLTINRWSTDEERDRLAKVFSEGGPDRILEAFGTTGAVGYLQWPGGLEYTIRYARRVTRPDGAVDLVLVADRQLWVWWDQALSKFATQPAPYTVIQIRIGKDGTGEGRASVGAKITSDAAAGVAVAGLAQQPVIIRDLRPARS